jgi:radical SAM superfamily enzyme YgiQ (UPF0313 family)
VSRDILILQSPSIYGKSLLSPPLGIGYIGAALLKHQYNIKLMDLSIYDYKNLKSEVTNAIKEFKPKIVCISCTTETYNVALRILKLSKSLKDDIVTVMGGVHPTFTVEECITDENVDIVAIGEGENTIVEISNYYIRNEGTLEKIDGIAYKNNNRVVINKERNYIKDINEIPYPYRGDFDLSKYKVPLTIVSTRGCTGKCSFCVSRELNKNRYRERSISNIIDEIKTLDLDKYSRIIAFQDSTLTANSKRIINLCDALKNQIGNISWSCESRVDTLTIDILQRMKESGCILIEFGIESGSEKVLKEIRKDITKKEILSTMDMVKRVGINSVCTIMIGHPTDTKETMKESIEFAKLLKKEYGCSIHFNIVTPYPGTPFLKNKEEYGIEIKSKSYDDYVPNNAIMSTKELSAEEIRETYINAILDLSRID